MPIAIVAAFDAKQERAAPHGFPHDAAEIANRLLPLEYFDFLLFHARERHGAGDRFTIRG